MRTLSTSQMARAAGVHPNTVRRYAEWGLLPPVGRSASGYRRFTERHLDCLRLARLIYSGEYPGRTLRQSAVRVIRRAVDGDLVGAWDEAQRHLALVRAEQAHADAAAGLLERWAQGMTTESPAKAMSIAEAAGALAVTVDMLRHWERNGLLRVPRNPSNGYRLYGAPEIDRLRVIRALSRAGYSLAAILRMTFHLERGDADGLRQALDTPRPDEDVYVASDHWISTLARQASLAPQVVALVEGMMAKKPRIS